MAGHRGMVLGEDSAPSWIQKRGSGFFLGLSTLYLGILVALLIGRWRNWQLIRDLPDPIAGIIPLAVPWFGALGAVAISLYGVFDHTARNDWKKEWNYWHVGRPMMGALFGTIAFLIFVGVINATGSNPTFDGSARDLIPYFVLAFLVGYREATFRDLIKRATDLLLAPGGLAPAAVSITPVRVEFGVVAIGQREERPITIANTGKENLVVNPSGVVIEGEGFEKTDVDSVSGATIPPGSAASITIAFHPAAAQVYRGRITLHTSVGAFSAELLGTGG